jgi:hypothetical protein
MLAILLKADERQSVYLRSLFPFGANWEVDESRRGIGYFCAGLAAINSSIASAVALPILVNQIALPR